MNCTTIRAALRRLRGRALDESAQGLIEFALVGTMLCFMFLGTVDFGRFLYYQTALVSTARVGAEAAINHCPFSSSSCANTTTVTSDALVLWEASCEAIPYASLQPQFASCTAGTAGTWTPICASTCSNCTADLCVTPSTRSTGTQVTVSVGYRFQPITPLMQVFFPDKSCFTGDSTSTNHHTLCATSTGRVS